MSQTYVGDPDKGWKTSVKIHDDNNQPTAASFAAIAIPLLDDLAYLKARGIQDIAFATGTITGSGGTIIGPSGSANTWVNFTNANGFPSSLLLPHAGDFTKQPTVGDRLFVFARGPFVRQSAAASIRMLCTQDVAGPNETIAAVPGSEALVEADISEVPQHITLLGLVQITVTGGVRLQLQGRNTVSDPAYKVGIPGGKSHVFTYGAILIRPYL